MRTIIAFYGFALAVSTSLAAPPRGLRDKPEETTKESKPAESKKDSRKESKPAKATSQDAQIAMLIKQLGDPTWQVREDATKKLIEIGLPARKPLMAATKDADAEVAARSRRALEKIPWAVSSTDPADIKELMAEYQNQDRDGRAQLLRSLISKGRFKAIPPMMRIADLDPDEQIASAAAGYLMDLPFGTVTEYVRRYEFESDRDDLQLLQGWAWRLHDRKKSTALLGKVLATCELSIDGGASDEEIELRTMTLVAWLLELGATDRVQAVLPKLEKAAPGDSRLIYLRARLAEIKGDKAQAAALVAQALAAPPRQGVEPIVGHALSAGFLKFHKWHEWEANEWQAILKNSSAQPIHKVNALANLGYQAAHDARFDEAAEHYTRAGDLAEDNNLALRGGWSSVQAEGAWNRARSMMAKGDTSKLEDTIKEMIRLAPGHPDGAGELARLYAANGRKEEAEKILDEARDILLQKFEAAGGDPDDEDLVGGNIENEEPNYHNNLAWTYVVANLRPAEALEEAKKANAGAPFEVAYLDTLAESYFRNGNKAKAIETERYALSLEPDNDYLKRQIKRFERGDKNEPVPLHR